jgi:hypothetical protein
VESGNAAKVRTLDMKLSKAILLGSTAVAPKAGGQFFPESQAGCALGMAAIANGCSFHAVNRFIRYEERRTLGAEGVWGSWILREVVRPCNCWRFRVPHEMRIKDVIAHLFDHHVMTKKNWTLERLVAWVETVEPKEVPRPEISSPTLPRPAFSLSQATDWRHEAEQWQAVRQAFEARHTTRRKRGPTIV